MESLHGADGYYDFANVDGERGALFVARGDAVMKVDLASGAVTDRLASARRAHQVLILDQGRTLLETDGDSSTARFLDASNGKVLAEVATGKKPDAAFFDAHTGLIAVMNAGDGTVTLIDARSRRRTGTIAVGGGLEFGVSDGRGAAFVNIEDKNAIARIDLVTAKRVGTIALPGCDGPTGLALVGRGTRLISACANNHALVIDVASGRTIATLPIGGDPDAVLVDERRGLAFIPCGGSGTLIAVAISDPDHVHVVAAIPTQVGAKTGAVDPLSGRIYLPTAKLDDPKPGAKRGTPVPGSFVVLVLAPAV